MSDRFGAYVMQLDIARLSKEEFDDVLTVYGRYVSDIWFDHSARLFGVRLLNMPILALDGLHGTVNSTTRQSAVGIPTDERSDT